ncbi:MAG: aspartate aminotransferase family protein [Myxococcales bacterium]|nr:aspartate aminotransferase family protein [Myxococcales bacterium]
MPLPATGWNPDRIYAELEDRRARDVPWRRGRTYAYVFDGGPDVEEVGKRAYMAYLSENGLDPTAFPSLLGFENDLCAIARDHLHGGPGVVGTFTSGGTESIMLAVKAARDHARAGRGVTAPRMIVPITAHAAFHKAGRYLGVEVVATAVDPVSFRADVDAMRAAIDERTILVVGSASGYAHGVVDPITDIAALAAERGVLCHVDGCIGGFVLPYFERLGARVPRFDFRVPGVTSISMDLHKYALCPKGASVIMYRDDELRRAQYFACSGWTGYTMINSTIQSSKSGGPLAAAWAVMHRMGDAGYLEMARGLLAARDALVAGIGAIEGLRVMGEPEMCLLAFTSDALPVFPLADAMKARGWPVQPQLAFGPSRENLHLSINPSNLPWTDELLRDLGQARDEVRAHQGAHEGVQAMARAVADGLTGADALAMLPRMVEGLGGGGGGALPAEMARINAILNALPRPLQEQLLVRFFAMMFTPGQG